jgi:signal transduction histidine kinase
METGHGEGNPQIAMRDGTSVLPGTTTSVVLITLLTVLVALFSDYAHVDAVLRPLYFAVLFGFFHSIGRRQPEIRVLPFRLIVAGFGVITLGAAISAVIGLSGLTPTDFTELLIVNLERGAVYLLGLTLICYGIILWVPHLLQSQRILRRDYSLTEGKLRKSERDRSTLEGHFADVEGLRSLGELAAGIAHDLRNPLTIVKATAESLARRPRDREEVNEHIKVIGRNLEKADRTIAALLDLGKPTSCNPQPVNLEHTLTEVLGLISVEKRRHGVKIVRLGEHNVTVQADAKMLIRAVLNLMLNALQASAEGGEIQVIIRAFSFDEKGWGALAVADRGVGIQPESRARLFSPFFTTKPDGIGLGLLSTRRVVGEMGGRVGLYPRHRGGARALLLLPQASSQAGVPGQPTHRAVGQPELPPRGVTVP